MDIAEELARLHALHENGGLTDEEFATAKAKVLNQSSPAPQRSTLGDAANRYVSFQMVMAVVGIIVFLLVFFGVWLPGFHEVRGGGMPFTH